MSLNLLWTDKCFFLVLLVITGLVLNGMRRIPTRQAFKSVFSHPVPVAAAIILGFFLSIGIVDSIHFEPNTQSLLDKLLMPINQSDEKTYSAPLALSLFTEETRVVNKQVERIYPPLVYPKFTSLTQRNHFIGTSIVKAFALSLGLIIAMVLAIRISQHRQPDTGKRMSASVKAALFTLFCCVFIISLSYMLSRELHVLGTGKIGQDIFYTAVKSIRTGLMIGILTTLFMMPLALLLGISAGYFGGVIDDVIQYCYTTLSSIPGVLLITASVLSLQTFIENHPQQFATLEESADARLLALCLILGVTSWTSLCRLLRAETLKLKEIDYVLAAKALGTSPFNIIRKHLLPNVMHIVIITFVLDFSFLVLAEAVLSYVGVGVSPMTLSWGNMINAARLELARDPIVWWPMLAAFIFMFTLVLASNLFADAVEDAFNTRRL